jgi:hypothetical protein
MITNRQILGIIVQKEEYEKRLESLKAAKDICEWFNEGNAVNGIQGEYNQVMQEYEQWLDSEVQ